MKKLIKLLKAVVAVFNEYREDTDWSGVELNNADLTDANLRGADLSNADLKYADLRPTITNNETKD